MKLIVAEKAIAGKRIAEILAGKSIQQHSIGSAQAFSFQCGREQCLLIPLRGHIMDVDFPTQYAHWLGTDLNRLASSGIEYKGTEHAIINALKKVASDITEAVIATDSDREGESIGLEAVSALLEKNPHITVKRASFSAITPKDIGHAFSNPGELDYNFAESANARREIDLVWGAVLTRFLSLVSGRLGSEFISAGRVQTPTLALIVDRESGRRKFQKRTYWEVVATFEKHGKQFEALHKKGRFWEKAEADAVLAKKAAHGKVKDVKSTKRTLARPTPFNTTAFLRAATAIGFSAGEAMNMAEALYQQGYISYPRTDNAAYPPTINLREVLQEISKVQDFSQLSEKILSAGKIEPSRGKETKDHPPIYPVSAAPKEKVAPRHWKIYELVVRRFLSTLAEDAETLNQTVEILMNGEPFVAHGQLITKQGWKEFYPYSVLKEIHLPELKPNDTVNLQKLESVEKETQPPARYSQGSLIKLMEDNGLGTKATRHEIIKKLYARRYIHGATSIEPSNVAFAVIGVLENYCKRVTEPKMTAELEREMDMMVASKKTKAEVVNDSRGLLKAVLDELLKNKNQIGSDLRAAFRQDQTIGICPTCGGNMRIIRSAANKQFTGCTNYPKCTTTFPLPQKGRIFQSGKVCSTCGKLVVRVVGQRYRFEMCIDPNCPSKAEWKKKAEQRAEQASAKESAGAARAASANAKAQQKPRVKASRSKQKEEP